MSHNFVKTKEQSFSTCLDCQLQVKDYECGHANSSGTMFKLPWDEYWMCGQVPCCNNEPDFASHKTVGEIVEERLTKAIIKVIKSLEIIEKERIICSYEVHDLILKIKRDNDLCDEVIPHDCGRVNDF